MDTDPQLSRSGAVRAADTSPDRRVERTELALHRAQLALLLEKGYTKTTVKEIVGRANVGRSTFYAHHGGKEQLLLSGLAHLRSALLAGRRENGGGAGGSSNGLLGFSRTFFEHVHEYRAVLRASAGNETGPAVTRGLKRLLRDVVLAEIRRADRERRHDKIPEEAAIQFVVDGLLSVMSWWFERQPQLSPGEVDAIFCKLVQRPLAALQPG